METDAEEFVINRIRTLPKLDSIDAQIVMRDLYEKEFGIYDHAKINRNRPLASVAFHPAENINDYSLLEESMRTYISKGIKDKFGLSYTEFLELPLDIIEIMIRIGDEDLAKRSAELTEIERQFKT